jgi:pantothenate kinase-related protein Tda10
LAHCPLDHNRLTNYFVNTGSDSSLVLASAGDMEKPHYSPPWADTHIVGIAGSSGSGKTSLAVKIVSSLNLPWVVILSMVSETDCIRTIIRSTDFNVLRTHFTNL